MERYFRKNGFLLSAFLGFVLLVPFMLLEVVNRKGLNEGFPVPIFLLLWVLQTVFILLLLPVILDSEKTKKRKTIYLIIRVMAAAVVAFLWGALMIDQWSCFMGVPNCD